MPDNKQRQARLQEMFSPRSLAVLGAGTAQGRLVLENLRRGGFAGTVLALQGAGDVPALQAAPELAVIACAAPDVAEAMQALGARGCRAAIVTAQVAGLGEMARAARMRVLGPSSFGLAVPRLGLDASLSHLPVPAGHVALVTQSASLARAVIDWAGPNGVGFSQVTGIGGNADTGFGMVLDWLSRDGETRLVLLDIRRVRDRRGFMSAARAASRLRPVVALRPGGRLLDATGQADRVFEAALHRAGVFVVESLEAFLAAAETLSRSRPLRGEGLAIVTNAIGPGRLAADAALRAGIRLAILPPEAQTALTASLPADLIYGLVYAGSAAPVDVASLAAMVSAVPGVGGVLVLLAPTGPGDAVAVQAVIAAAHSAHLPVLSCVMGESTGAGFRHALAQAGLPVFATPEQAVAGFAHLLRARQARQAARELPGSRVLDVAPDIAASHAILDGASGSLVEGDALRLLAAYGLEGDAASVDRAVAIEVHDDATFGPAIGLTTACGPPAYDLPPLNLALARALAVRAGLQGDDAEAAADAMVRISQLLVDWPQIASLRIERLVLGGGRAAAGDARIGLHEAGVRSHPAISPYPEQLAHEWQSGGQAFLIRPIRPEDATAHAALVARVPAEDLRFRFFSAMRQVSPEQMARLTQIDYEREMAFLAVRQADGASVGVGRLVCEPAGGSGEFALLVQPDAKGLGLGRHLMDCLIGWARARGLARIEGHVLADNHPMLGFVRHLGFALRHMSDDSDVMEAVLDLSPASDQRG